MRPEPDRRVRRTRRALHDALLDLMVEKGYDAVSVQDIIDRADVGRSTFYSHFTDKNALLRSGFEELRSELERPVAPPRGRARLFRFSLPMFEHARDQQRLVHALVARPDSGPVLGILQQILGDSVRADLATFARQGAGPPDDILIAYVVGAFLAVMTSWLDTAPEKTPDEIDQIFHRLVAPGVRSTLVPRTAPRAPASNSVSAPRPAPRATRS